MTTRKKMAIIVLPHIKMFHFTQSVLAGIRNEAWYPYTEGKLFEYVEKYLVHADVAANVTRIDKIQQCGQSIDYLVTFNEVKSSVHKGKINHAFEDQYNGNLL
jgi:hypothetical protein